MLTKKYFGLSLRETVAVLKSKVHEHRLTALFILIEKYKHSKNKEKKEIVNLYLKNIKYINNWDLVDASAHYILGDHLLNKPKTILYKLAGSTNLWERRIAVIATFTFIKNKKFDDTLKIAKILINDKHDLIHKAVGWMLWEVGKINIKEEKKFLNNFAQKMPRTMLRYAIEKFPKQERQRYLHLT